MILVNGKKVEFTQFPDGTTSFKFNAIENAVDHRFGQCDIQWDYDGDNECILLWYLTKHIRSSIGSEVKITLYMPYIPNARMDRVKNADEVFTLKWFAEFINSLGFYKVFVFDPHSSVSTALLNNVSVIQPISKISDVMNFFFKDENLLLCYPDEGAAKRYSELMQTEYVFGIKHRDWRTGKIERLELTSPEKVAGRKVLIVDDICSRGGTFTHMAKALKDAGADKIYLYITHCENTIFDGSVLTDGMIEHVYTTDSIFRGEHDKITVL